jgi:Secretion system C-terminal sorting domain
MNKIFSAFLLVLTFGLNAQTFDFPLNSNLTLLTGRNITVSGQNMVPVAIATRKSFVIGQPEKVAVSWYDVSYSYGSQTNVRIYNSMADFENNVSGMDYTSFIGVEALAYDNTIAGNLFVMETENAGGKLRVFDAGMNEIASYTSGDIGTVLGAGFNNSRGIDFDNQNNVYIADDANNRIIKIENPTNQSSAIISEFLVLPSGSSPKSLAIANGMMYVACFNSSLVKIYDMQTLNIIDEINTGSSKPLDLAIQKQYGNHVYVSMVDLGLSIGSVKAYDFSSNLIQTYSNLGYTNGPWGLNVNESGDLYCSDGSNGRFVKYARTRLTGNDFESFTVDDQIGLSDIDLVNKTVNISVPNSYDMLMVNTHYTTSFRATASPFDYDYNLIPTDFSSGNTVEYTITAENGSIATWNVTLNPELGINEVSKNSVDFYPNPVTSTITFSSFVEKIELLNCVGQVILEVNNTKTVDCSNLNSGTYIIRINQIETSKFIKL